MLSEYDKKVEAIAEKMAIARIDARFYASHIKWNERNWQERKSLILDEVAAAKIALEMCCYWHNEGLKDGVSGNTEEDIQVKLKRIGLKK